MHCSPLLGFLLNMVDCKIPLVRTRVVVISDPHSLHLLRSLVAHQTEWEYGLSDGLKDYSVMPCLILGEM